MNDLLEIKNLVKFFPTRRTWWGRVREWKKAVNGISFCVPKGKTYALVGESGCGKTTAGRCLLRLVEPTSGEIFYHGENLLTLSKRNLTACRRGLQMIFQDPYSSLNSRFSAGAIVAEGWEIHQTYSAKERAEHLPQLFADVGLLPESIDRFPHEFSGGQRQRLGIARALALSPEFIVCDEAVSALDVSIQAQIINLLLELQEQRGIAYLFISHNLAVVRYVAHRVGVMYAGRLVEEADAEELFANPRHPYTQLLLRAIPEIGGAKITERKFTIESRSLIPSAVGCEFADRCERCRTECRNENIAERDCNGHRVRCLFAD